MEGIKLVFVVIGSVVGVAGLIWTVIWVINKNTSLKDTAINKGYNRNLETKIDLNKENLEAKISNQKDDIKESKDEISELKKTVGAMATSVTKLSGSVENLVQSAKEDRVSQKENTKAQQESTKAIMETNRGIREENIILKETNRIANANLEDKSKTWKGELNKISESFLDQVNDPQIRKDLEKHTQKINGRIDKIQDDVKDIKKEVSQFNSLREASCPEAIAAKAVRDALNKENPEK